MRIKQIELALFSWSEPDLKYFRKTNCLISGYFQIELIWKRGMAGNQTVRDLKFCINLSAFCCQKGLSDSNKERFQFGLHRCICHSFVKCFLQIFQYLSNFSMSAYFFLIYANLFTKLDRKLWYF